MKKGILIGGNWIIDQVKMIDMYPGEEMLVNISCEYQSNGGAAYNVLKALSKIKAPFPLSGIGLVGDDTRGEKILEECKMLGINTEQLRKTNKAGTSYTDVMIAKRTGKRTFFHFRGANSLLDVEHFDFSVVKAKIFHLGYLLLLDNLDKIDSNGMTRASAVFKKAKEEGMITSADIVSECSGRFRDIISAFPYIDYLFVNEYEAGRIAEIKTVSDCGQILYDQCYAAACEIIRMGIKKWVVLHFEGGVIVVNDKLKDFFTPSINVPPQKIVGAVGAGDAFAAGTLMGIHQEWNMEDSIKLGICSAASCLFAATCSDGILPYPESLSLQEMYGYRDKERLLQPALATVKCL